MKRVRISIMILFIAASLSAQQTDDVRQAVADILEPLAEKQLIPEDYSELLDDLIFLHQHPLNLNSATKEDLERIPFLNDYQIENILFYVYNNGPMLTIYEMNAVEGLSPETIKQIIPFLTVAPVEKAVKIKNRLSAELITRGRTTVQTPKGYQPLNDTTPAIYAGSREKLYTRIRINYGNRLFAGFTMEKDPGEPAFSAHIPLTDFLSGYLMFKSGGIIKNIIIGDYKTSFGQGLGLWSGLAFSKNSEVIDIRRRAKKIVKYSSVNENSFFRGVATQLAVKDLNLYLFGSYRKHDGTLSGTYSITSLRTDGYHRTRTELGYRNNITETAAGGVITWNSQTVEIEVGQTFWKINKPLIHQDIFYRLNSFTGDSLFTSFLNYTWFGHKVILFGEAALQNFHNTSFYQGMTFSPGADIQIALSYRNYNKKYFSVISNPFAESSYANGENGVYFGLSCMPFHRLTVKSYVDIFWHKWLKYRADKPATGSALLLQGDYSFNERISAMLRYKHSVNERNKLYYYENDFPVTSRATNSVRIQVNYSPGSRWWFRARLEQNYFNEKQGHTSKGFLFYLDIKHAFAKNRFTADVRIAHFDTDDYYSRIYVWEPDVLHVFSIPFYSGNGVRFIFNLAYSPVRNLKFWFRLANTYMPDAENIGSGYNAVAGNDLTEIKLQLKYTF